jgi:hypothetical protein
MPLKTRANTIKEAKDLYFKGKGRENGTVSRIGLGF